MNTILQKLRKQSEIVILKDEKKSFPCNTLFTHIKYSQSQPFRLSRAFVTFCEQLHFVLVLRYAAFSSLDMASTVGHRCAANWLTWPKIHFWPNLQQLRVGRNVDGALKPARTLMKSPLSGAECILGANAFNQIT